MKIEELMAAIVPAPESPRPDCQYPPPPIAEPDRDETDYLEWRQELL